MDAPFSNLKFDSNGLMYVSDNARHIYVFQVTG